MRDPRARIAQKSGAGLAEVAGDVFTRELSGFSPSERMEFSPGFDVTENKDAYVFKADLKHPAAQAKKIPIAAAGAKS